MSLLSIPFKKKLSELFGQDEANKFINILESDLGDAASFDTISEATDGSGVTVDGLLIRDSGIPAAAVTAHQAALTILETQITNGTLLARVGSAETITQQWDFGTTAPKSDTFEESTSGAGITADSVLLKDGAVLNTKNIGTAGTNVAALEYGDGYHHITVLTLTAVSLGAPTAGGNSAHGSLIYTFPAGVHLHTHTYFSVGLTMGGNTTDAPDVGVGSAIGTGAIATLNGTTMEDYVTGITWSTTLDGTAEVQDTIPATAGVFSGISNNASGDTKLVHFNAADGWNAAVTGNLTATGTLVLIWDTLA